MTEASLTDWIQALSAVAMVGLTLGLVILSLSLGGITYWYALHTKRMADTMVRDYESKVSPLLDGPRFTWGHPLRASMHCLRSRT